MVGRPVAQGAPTRIRGDPGFTLPGIRKNVGEVLVISLGRKGGATKKWCRLLLYTLVNWLDLKGTCETPPNTPKEPKRDGVN